MSSRIQLVQNDTRPTLIVALRDRDTGLGIDVSAASTVVVLKFRAAGTTTVLTTITATKLPYQLATDGSLDLSVTTAGAGGRISFAWPAGSLNVPTGYYEGEIVITFSDGTKQTIYDVITFNVRSAF